MYVCFCNDVDVGVLLDIKHVAFFWLLWSFATEKIISEKVLDK